MAETTDQGDRTKKNTAPKGGRGGLFARLFAKNRARIDIRICPILSASPDVDGNHITNELVSVLRPIKGLRAKILNGAFKSAPDVPLQGQLAAINTQAFAAMTKADADVLIWGEVGPQEDTIDLYFVSREQAPGFCHGVSCTSAPLTLPLPLDVTLEPVFIAVTLAAVWLNPVPSSTEDPTAEPTPEQAKDTVLRRTLSRALEDAIQVAQKPPHVMKLHDRATLLGCFAGAVAKAAQLWNQAALFRTAADLYETAIRNLARDVGSPGWATAQRNTGVVLESLGDREKDQKEGAQNKAGHLYQAAAASYRASLDAQPVPHLSADRAWVRFRLGQTVYKTGVRTGESEPLVNAITIMNEAMTDLPTTLAVPHADGKPTSPHPADRTLLLFRSEIMNSIGKVAQYYGGEEQDPERTKESIQAFRAALEIRKRDWVPSLWAGTQSNMGSALFLLGRLTGDKALFHAAKGAFAGAHEAYVALGMGKMASLAEKNLTRMEDMLSDEKKDETPMVTLPPLDWETDEDGS